MSDNKNIFKKHFESGMIVRNFNSFQRTHPTLLKCILAAMKEVEENKKQLSIKAIDFADFIQSIEAMKEKEEKNLCWLIKNDASIDAIRLSRKYYNYFSQRIKEYKEFTSFKQQSIKAIAFAEWLVDNCWIKNSNGLWYFESDADIDEGITTTQLFELFEKELKNKTK